MTVIHGCCGICGYCVGLRLMSEGRDLRGRQCWCFFVAFFWTWCAIWMSSGEAAAEMAVGIPTGGSTSALAHAASSSSSSDEVDGSMVLK
eukprot:CAMPEP_0183351458 /NCGR_PEP_ID=MMETSP0164_2-20130417/25004_1 /TAXON_ID=221442 /ORGANISM="Coccolithus pelagicus ssp braarudi, Strain PLY182g" /LENGTH=89 /DNA_ID=CAMNT_0025523647 /DNA_START=172 /DNA_END=441 /DNA_ORIENTATION=-